MPHATRQRNPLRSGGMQAPSNFIAEFDKQIGLIADNPELYGLSRVPELAAVGYRAALVNSYIFLYYISDKEVHVAFLFHQSQDYARYVV